MFAEVLEGQLSDNLPGLQRLNIYEINVGRLSSLTRR